MGQQLVVLRTVVRTMSENLSVQTAAAFERITEALIGKTDDDLGVLIQCLDKLSKKAKEIKDISACMITGDC